MTSNKNTKVLVTGGTGFVSAHLISKLLQQGYFVKTTVRSLSRKSELERAITDTGITDLTSLSFIEADLTKDENWSEAVKDCKYVLHVASPFPGKDPEDENELIIPARDGALRVLKAASLAGVQRVVLTSSFAAIGYSIADKNHTFTEQDWTDINVPLPAYIKSKTVAERAAWDFIANEGKGLELTVINPVGIFGPVIGEVSSASLDVVVNGILSGTTTVSPDFTMGVVDVRDVADIHLLAMIHPLAKGERFLATSEGSMSFYDVAQLIKKERAQFATNIADLNVTDASHYIKLSNEKARKVLNWNPRTKEEAILASVDSKFLI